MTIREAVVRINSHCPGTFLHTHAMKVILREYRTSHFAFPTKKVWDKMIKSLPMDDELYEYARVWAVCKMYDKFGRLKYNA